MPEPKLVPPAEHAEDDVQDYAFLGREFMTWLLWRVSRGEVGFEDDGGAFSIGFGGKLRMTGPAGDVTDAVLKGRSPGASVELAAGLGAGRTVREAELSIARGDREFRLTLVAETLDWRSVKLPSRLKNEGDDRLGERTALLDELESAVGAAFQAFVKERTRPVWGRSVIPEMRTWLAEMIAVD
jgi:hypothetical protein